MKERSICRVEGCGDSVGAHGADGMCSKHYTRNRRNGDPMVVQYIRGDDRARFESHVDRSGGPDACHPWTGGQCNGGYAQIRMNGELRLVHVVAWEFKNGPKPSGVDIDHECHNRAVRDGTCRSGICPHRLCCNEGHLAAKTRQEHCDDTPQWGQKRGSSHSGAKLTEKQVIEIRKLLAAKVVSQYQIAEWYGVKRRTISNIKQGVTWGWLQEQEVPQTPAPADL